MPTRKRKRRSYSRRITSGQFLNQAALGAESAMGGRLLGRNAAYSGKPLTWEELQKSKEVYEPKIDITKFA